MLAVLMDRPVLPEDPQTSTWEYGPPTKRWTPGLSQTEMGKIQLMTREGILPSGRSAAPGQCARKSSGSAAVSFGDAEQAVGVGADMIGRVNGAGVEVLSKKEKERLTERL